MTPPARDNTEEAAQEADDPIRVAGLAKALAHPARVRIIGILMRRSTCNGYDIVEELGLAASTTSEHLKILRTSGVVIGALERPRVAYSLNPEAIEPLLALLRAVRSTMLPPAPEEVAHACADAACSADSPCSRGRRHTASFWQCCAGEEPGATRAGKPPRW